MIIRAQSQRSLSTQRTVQPVQQTKLPCTASQRHGPALARHGSVPDLHRLQATSDLAVNSIQPSKSKVEVKEKQLEVEYSSALTATSIGTILGLLLLSGPAYAAYDRSVGDQLFKNLAGSAYVLLVCFFFYRLFRKRAISGTSQSLRGTFQESLQDEMKAKETVAEDKPVTSIGALWGAVQAGAICFVLFQVCGLVDGYFDGQEMPDQYTARNITVTLRTIVRGLAYLMTFLFGVNCVGLSGLAVQLLFFPEKPAVSKQEDNTQS